MRGGSRDLVCLSETCPNRLPPPTAPAKQRQACPRCSSAQSDDESCQRRAPPPPPTDAGAGASGEQVGQSQAMRWPSTVPPTTRHTLRGCSSDERRTSTTTSTGLRTADVVRGTKAATAHCCAKDGELCEHSTQYDKTRGGRAFWFSKSSGHQQSSVASTTIAPDSRGERT